MDARRVVAAALALFIALAACGGGSTTAPSASEPSLDGTWRFSADFADAGRRCSQTGPLGLREEGVTKGELYSYLHFAGSITITQCSCPDLYCAGGPEPLAGDFISAGSFVGKVGSFETDLGRYGFECPVFFIDEAQPNRLSGQVECSFGPWFPRPPGQTGNPYVPQWTAKGAWMADRQ